MTKVGLVQINNSFSGQNYLPLSVGMLQAYAENNLSNPDEFEWLMPIYKRLPVKKAVNHLKPADIVFFSVYVWNFQLSLAIAKALNCRVIFGGPHVTEDLPKKYPFIDEICKGEGERASVAILDNNPLPQGRIHEMNALPSPYLQGVFDPLVKENPKENWIALWETNRGCPFSCTFCDWGSAVNSKVFKFELDRLYREVDWFAEHKIEYVYCCDANFGMLPRDLDIAQYVVNVKRHRGYPHKLSVQNTKNSTERSYAVQKLLSDNGLNQGVTVSMQSMDIETLKAVKRQNISIESFQTIQKRFTEDDVITYTDLILGLPGETYPSFVDGAVKVIEGGQNNRIQFNNLSILPGAEMADPEYQKRYGMETVEANIINLHGSLDEHEIQEKQVLVIGTEAMPKRHWVLARAASWMISLLYFDKLIQLPLQLMHDKYGFSYQRLFAMFMNPECVSPNKSTYNYSGDINTLLEIRDFFVKKAEEIQNGGEEFCYSKDWLGIWWPADEYIFIKLTVEDKLGAFYLESCDLLNHFLIFDNDKEMTLMRTLVRNEIRLKQPKGDLNKWLREVVWWGNKTGAYLNDDAR